jgi:MFS family permease
MSARAAVAITFALNGLLYGAWAARIPAVRDRLDLSAGKVGVALAFIAAGALAGMPLAGRAAARFGSRPTTRAARAALALTSAVVSAAPSLVALCLACALLGFAGGSLDVAMNAHAVAVERRAGRPILSSFHAAFSVGGLAGALLGAAGAAAGVDVRVELAALSAAAAAIGLAATHALLPAGEDRRGALPPAAVAARPRVWSTRLAALGLLAFFCLLCEGAAADWSGIYVDHSLGGSAAVAGLAYAAFSVTMVAGRLSGDRLTTRFGSPALVRAGALVAAAGLGAALLAGSPGAALAGFACLGAGLSTIIPQVFRAAAETGASGPAIAAASTVGYTGFLAGPPLIGALAELTSLPVALGLLPLLALATAAFAGATRARGGVAGDGAVAAPA